MDFDEPSLRFTRVQVFELDPGPLPRPFQDATMGPFRRWTLKWLRLTDDQGAVGEAPAGVDQATAERLVSDGPMSLAQWHHRLWWMHRNAGHRNPATSSQLFAFETAAVDVLARRAGLAWHRYLGAERDSVPVYASGGGTNAGLDDLLAQAKRWAEAGYPLMKMKVATDFGRRMDADVDRVRAVREAIGPRMGLAVDANQAWSAEQAITFAHRIEPLGITWLEEPVAAADRHAITEVCRRSPVPVAMGESENHWLGARDLVECGVDHVQVNPAALPGVQGWQWAQAHARQAKRGWSAGGLSHLTAALVATQPEGIVEYLEDIIGHLATCFATGPTIVNGQIQLSTEQPGLPVRVDWDRFAARQAVLDVT